MLSSSQGITQTMMEPKRIGLPLVGGGGDIMRGKLHLNVCKKS